MIEERIKFEEKELKPMSGWLGLLIGLILILIFKSFISPSRSLCCE